MDDGFGKPIQCATVSDDSFKEVTEGYMKYLINSNGIESASSLRPRLCVSNLERKQRHVCRFFWVIHGGLSFCSSERLSAGPRAVHLQI